MGDDVRSNHFDIFPIIFTHPILLPRPAWHFAVETHFPGQKCFFGLLPHWYAFLCCKAATFDLRLCIMACFKICLSSDWRQRVAFSRCRMIATRRKEEVSTFGIHIFFQKLSTLEPIKSSVNLFRQWVWDLLQNMHTPRNLIEKDPCLAEIDLHNESPAGGTTRYPSTVPQKLWLDFSYLEVQDTPSGFKIPIWQLGHMGTRPRGGPSTFSSEGQDKSH